MKPGSCPQFESPEPLLIPVGFQIPISFQGKNLDNYMVSSVTLIHHYYYYHLLWFISVNNVRLCLQGQRFSIGTELMGKKELTVTGGQGSKFEFTGYEVGMKERQQLLNIDNCKINQHLKKHSSCPLAALRFTSSSALML